MAKIKEDYHYRKSVKLLAEEIQGVLAIQPLVITGPKTASGRQDVYYDNRRRRFFVIRPRVGDESTKSYLPSDIEEQEKKW